MRVHRRLYYKLRYSPLARLSLDGLRRLGIGLFPYYVMVEAPSRPRLRSAKRGLSEYEIAHLEPREARRLPEAFELFAVKDAKRRLRDGQRCLAARHGGEIVAVTWYNVRRAEIFWHSFEPIRRFDPATEAVYLFQRK